MTDRIDDAFLARVYRTTAVVAALMVLATLSRYPWRTTVSLVVGVALGLLFLALIAHGTRPMLQPDQAGRGGRRARLVLQVGKFAVAGGAMYLLARLDYLDGAALAIGYGLPTTILLLKLVGQMLTRGQPQDANTAGGPAVTREEGSACPPRSRGAT